MNTKDTDTVGVIIARFQVHKLHKLHKELVDHVVARHKKVVIMIGVAPVISRENPLDFLTRQAMLRELYPTVIILPLADRPDDFLWSRSLDESIRAVFPTESIKLYGGRDSFARSYKGNFEVAELTAGVLSLDEISGSEIRAEIAGEIPLGSEDFRAGAIYVTQKQFPKVYPTVDIAVVRKNADTYELLMGKKKNSKYYCFPGGFTDPSDQSYEEAAIRELFEETTLEVKMYQLQYIKSMQIRDWRYTKTDKITTLFYLVDMTKDSNFDKPVVASDDLAEVSWVPLVEQNYLHVVLHHRELFRDIMNRYPQKIDISGWEDHGIEMTT